MARSPSRLRAADGRLACCFCRSRLLPVRPSWSRAVGRAILSSTPPACAEGGLGKAASFLIKLLGERGPSGGARELISCKVFAHHDVH